LLLAALHGSAQAQDQIDARGYAPAPSYGAPVYVPSPEPALQFQLAAVQTEIHELEAEAWANGYTRQRRLGYGLMVGGFGVGAGSAILLFLANYLQPTGSKPSVTFDRAMVGTMGAALVPGFAGLIMLALNKNNHPDLPRSLVLTWEEERLRKAIKRARKEEKRARKLARQSSLSVFMPREARGAGLVWFGKF
jgi:hypothetical protein